MHSRAAHLLAIAVASLAIASSLSGCSGSNGGSGVVAAGAATSATPSGSLPVASATSSASPPAAAQTKPVAQPTFKFNGMPKHCPPADEITLAVRVSIPHLYEQSIGDALNCTYYVDDSKTSPGANLTFGDQGINDPAGAVVAWKANLSAFPSAVLVPGVGDGAVYYLAPGGISAFNFISNGVTCNMYTGNLQATQAQLTDLAQFILEG